MFYILLKLFDPSSILSHLQQNIHKIECHTLARARTCAHAHKTKSFLFPFFSSQTLSLAVSLRHSFSLTVIKSKQYTHTHTVQQSFVKNYDTSVMNRFIFSLSSFCSRWFLFLVLGACIFFSPIILVNFDLFFKNIWFLSDFLCRINRITIESIFQQKCSFQRCFAYKWADSFSNGILIGVSIHQVICDVTRIWGKPGKTSATERKTTFLET